MNVKPENITMNETDDFLIFCEYDSNPNSLETVRWFQNGRPLNLNQSRYDGGNTEQSALLVKNATRNDIGTYFCELTNSIGTGMSDSGVFVNIQCEYLLILFKNKSVNLFEKFLLNTHKKGKCLRKINLNDFNIIFTREERSTYK